MKLIIDKNKCVGCRTCELICSFHHKKMFNPEYSSIRIFFNDNGELDIKLFPNCDCKDEPLCIEYCPTKAILIK